MTTKNSLLPVLAAVALLGVSACAPQIANRGNLIKDYQLVTLKPGTTTKSDVLKALGSPTTQDPFDENTWFYMGQVTSKTGVFDPKVTSERILKITFDKDGTMTAMNDVGGHREDLPIVRDKTPTSGNEVTVMQQFFGNLGRFNGQGLKPAGNPTGDLPQ